MNLLTALNEWFIFLRLLSCGLLRDVRHSSQVDVTGEEIGDDIKHLEKHLRSYLRLVGFTTLKFDNLIENIPKETG